MITLFLTTLSAALGAEPCSRLRLQIDPAYQVTSVDGFAAPNVDGLTIDAPGGMLTLGLAGPHPTESRSVQVQITDGVEHQCAVDGRGLTCTRSVRLSGDAPAGAVDLCTPSRVVDAPVAPVSQEAATRGSRIGLEGVTLPAPPADAKSLVTRSVVQPEQIIPLHLVDRGRVHSRLYYDERGRVLTKDQVITLLKRDGHSAQTMKERETLMGTGTVLAAISPLTGGLPLLIAGTVCLGAGSGRLDHALVEYNRGHLLDAQDPLVGRDSDDPDAGAFGDLDADGDWIGLHDED